VGNGIVYCSRYLDQEAAMERLLGNIEGEVLTKPNVLRFGAGMRQKQWNRNCVAIGLSAGFMEPLESQSIFLIQVAISRLLQSFPDRGFEPADIDYFNKLMSWEYERIRDFLVLHFNATSRDDTPYWDYCRNMAVPDYLAEKKALFQGYGRIFRDNNELFSDYSWFSIFIGQRVMPRSYEPMVDVWPLEDLRTRMAQIRSVIANSAEKIPLHWDFIAQNCAAPPP
jgi:tryptophan halogenase